MMNKKGAIVFLLAFVMLFSFILSVSAYTNNAGTCMCNSCGDCSAAFQYNTGCNKIELAQSIDEGTSCDIGMAGNDIAHGRYLMNNQIFDCKGKRFHGKLEGVGSNATIMNCKFFQQPSAPRSYIDLTPTGEDVSRNVTIKNNTFDTEYYSGATHIGISGEADNSLVIDNNFSLTGDNGWMRTTVDTDLNLDGDNVIIRSNHFQGKVSLGGDYNNFTDNNFLGGGYNSKGDHNNVLNNDFINAYLQIFGDYNLIEDNNVDNPNNVGTIVSGISVGDSTQTAASNNIFRSNRACNTWKVSPPGSVHWYDIWDQSNAGSNNPDNQYFSNICDRSNYPSICEFSCDGGETCTPGCEDGQQCLSGTCVEACVPECELVGQRICSVSPIGTQVCGNFDGDACLEWGSVNACTPGDACNNYSCNSTNPGIDSAYWAGYDSNPGTWLEINNASIGRVVQLVVTTHGYADGTQVAYDIQRNEGNLHITTFNSTLSGSYSTAQWVIPSDLFVDNQDATYHFFFDAQVINSQKQSNNLAVSTNYEPPVNPPAGCGGAINESQCLVATPASCPNAQNQCTYDCSCYWDTALGCKLQVSQECIYGNTLCRWANETITTCTDGVRSIIREGGFNVTGNGTCQDFTSQEPCGKASILLPFFSATNAIIIVLIIILIYVISMKKKLFKKKSKFSKKR